MLNKINLTYLAVGVILYSILAFHTPMDKGLVYLFSIGFFLSYYAIIRYTEVRGDSFYKQDRLLIIVAFYLFNGIIFMNILSYDVNGNFFVFSESDAIFYDDWGKNLTRDGFQDGITNFLKHNSFEDLGMVLLAASLYQFFESNLMINLFFLIIGVLSAKYLFKLGINFMSRKYAFLSSVSYSCASFMVWFNSSGLKESVLIFLLIFLFERYYAFRVRKKMYYVFQIILLILAIGFFRPVLSGFFVFSIGMAYIIEEIRNIRGVFLALVLIIVGVIAFPVILGIYNNYTAGGDITYLLAIREYQGMVIGSIGFTYAVNVLSQFFGPLATFSPAKSELLSLYAPGLLYRILLGLPFWIGVMSIFHKRMKLFYPILFFIFMEMISLIVILEGLELRKALIHIPFVFIVAFYFLNDQSFLNKIWTKQIAGIGIIIMVLLIVIWNLRFAAI